MSSVPQLDPGMFFGRRTESGLYLPGEARPQRPKALDLFAGCGGFSLGCHQAGWHVIAALEFDFAAAHTYMVNLARPGVKIHFDTPEREAGFETYLRKALGLKGTRKRISTPRGALAGSGWISGQPDSEPGCEHFWIADVRNVTGRQILDALGMEVGELDCVFGGPPCQGFSTAGKRDVMDPRNSLVFEFARLVCELKPKTTVMENVPAIRSMVTPEGLSVVDEFVRILEEGDYAPHKALVKAVGAAPGSRAIARQGRKTEPGETEGLDAEQLALEMAV